MRYRYVCGIVMSSANVALTRCAFLASIYLASSPLSEPKAIEWCRKYGLRVNLDLHAVPGAQNPWNHSGT